jgi:ribosomal protein L9
MSNKKEEIILLEKQKFGNVYDIVKVNRGFALNFLLPFNKAMVCSKQNIS